MASTITGEPTLTVGELHAKLAQEEDLRGTIVTKDGADLLIPQIIIDYPAVDSAFLLCFADLASKSLRVTTLRALLDRYPAHYDLYLGTEVRADVLPLGVTAVGHRRNLIALECGLCWFAY
jgi:hypothetical protein